MKILQWIWKQVKGEKGSSTVEGAIWIPFIFFAVFLVVRILLQWTELGIVQGEMTYFLSSQVTYDRQINKKAEQLELASNIHFLQNPIWNIWIQENEYIGRFQAIHQEPRSSYVEKKICIKMENPIKKLRGRERVEHMLQEVGLP